MAPSLVQTDVPIHVVAYDRNDFTFQKFAEHDIFAPAHIFSSVHKRQAEFFFGRWAARQALAPLGLAHFTVKTGAAREPVWPPGILGSITHNHRYAAAVALRHAEQAGIGIDLEEVVEAEMQEILATTVVSAPELAFLSALAVKLDFNVLLTLIFSAKESFFKAAYNLVGSYFDFDAMTILRVDVELQMLWFRIEKDLCAALRTGDTCSARYAFIDSKTIVTSCQLFSAV